MQRLVPSFRAFAVGDRPSGLSLLRPRLRFSEASLSVLTPSTRELLPDGQNSADKTKHRKPCQDDGRMPDVVEVHDRRDGPNRTDQTPQQYWLTPSHLDSNSADLREVWSPATATLLDPDFPPKSRTVR